MKRSLGKEARSAEETKAWMAKSAAVTWGGEGRMNGRRMGRVRAGGEERRRERV
jgi:hypothetical protein